MTHRSPGRVIGVGVVVGAATVMGIGLPGCQREAEPGEAVRVLASFGSLGDIPGRFAYPRALDVDPTTKTVWVIDKTARVQQLDAKTGEVVAIFRMPLFETGKPTGVTVARGEGDDPLLYVPDTHYNRVMIYKPAKPKAGQRNTETPELVGSFGEFGTGPGQFTYPTDVAVLRTSDDAHVERIYVSEYGGNDRVSVFDGSYHFLFSFGSFGSDASPTNVQFDRPQSVAIDLSEAGQKASGGRGRLVITDGRNSRVGTFTLDGKLIKWFGSLETASGEPGHFRNPYGIDLVGDGTALIAEYGNDRIQRIDLDTGGFVGSLGRTGRGEGELVTPWAVATMDGRTYILDSGNNRVVACQAPRKR